MTKFSFEAIGTHWEIDIKEEISKELEISLYKKIMDRIEIFDKDYSRFREDSLVTKISRQAGEYAMPEDFDYMFQIYKKAYGATNGLVTPLVGDVLISLGYDAKYSLEKKSLVTAVPLEEIVVWSKPVLYIKQPTMLDIGACGKGYLVDIVSEIIEKEGIKKFIVDGSGDMKVFGEEIKVGLEHPEDKQSVIGTILLKDKSLCGSSGNRRKWADVHHIVNPKTGVSPKNVLSVWVVAESTILADILTTCLFFVSAESLKKDFDFDYLILKDDYSVEFSGGINAEIFKE